MNSEKTDGSAVNKGIKISAIAIALVGALYFGFFRGSAEGQPDGPESAAPYICLECNEPFKVTPAEYERLSKSGGLKTIRVSEDDRRGQLRFRCPKCDKFGGVPAMICPNDGTSVSVKPVNGKPSKCPKCGWTP